MDNLSIISQNIRSLKNFNELKNEFNNCIDNIGILMVQEIWQPRLLNYNLPGFHSPIFNSREREGGGVGIWVKGSLHVKILDNLDCFYDGLIEMQILRIAGLTKKEITVINVYRPPSGDIIAAQNVLEQKILEINIKFGNDPIIIGGDFNLDLNKRHCHNETGQFYDMLENYDLIPQILDVTRVTATTATTIDNIITKNIAGKNPETICTVISDHYACKLDIQGIKKKCIIHKRVTTKLDYTKIKMALREEKWDIEELNCQEGYQYLVQKIQETVKNYSRETSMGNFKRYVPMNPWMNGTLLEKRETIRKYLLKGRNKQSKEIAEKLQQLKTEYQREIRKAKKDHYLKKLDLAGGDSRKVWKVINEVVGREQAKISQEMKIQTTNGLTDNKNMIANEFNNFFRNIGLDLASQQKSKESFSKFLGKKSNKIFNFQMINHHNIWAVIQTIKPKQSRGPDGISNHLLKHIAEEISKPLATIINKSLKEGTVPKEMKIAKIIPLFKKGQKEQMSNYRPISLLNVISKILEKVVSSQVMSYFEENNLFYKHQYGFRCGHNTIHPILNFVQKIEDCKNKKEHSAAVFCDLKKPLIQ